MFSNQSRATTTAFDKYCDHYGAATTAVLCSRRPTALGHAFHSTHRPQLAGSCLSRTGVSILGVVYALPDRAVYSRILPIAMSHRRRGVLIVYPNRLLLAVVAVAVLFGIGSWLAPPHRTSQERE